MKRLDDMLAEKKNIEKKNYFVLVSLSCIACNSFHDEGHFGCEVYLSPKDYGDCKLVFLKKSNQIFIILALLRRSG